MRRARDSLVATLGLVVCWADCAAVRCRWVPCAQQGARSSDRARITTLGRPGADRGRERVRPLRPPGPLARISVLHSSPRWWATS